MKPSMLLRLLVAPGIVAAVAAAAAATAAGNPSSSCASTATASVYSAPSPSASALDGNSNYSNYSSGGDGNATTPLPMNYGLVLFPGFAALDVFGPIDVLNLLAGFRPPMNLYILAATLDPVSNRLHNDTTLAFSGFYPGDSGAGSNSSSNSSSSSSPPPYPLTRFAEHIVPTHTFADAARLPLDVLIVPGHSGGHIPPATHAPAAAFVAATFPRLRYLLSVCSGARVLVDAGVLAGRRATTNKFGWRQITAESAAARRVRWVAQARWVVDGNVWTASGISAGIDMALAFVRHLHGAPLAQWLADSMEYEWHTDAAWDPYAVLNNLTTATTTTDAAAQQGAGA